VEEPDGVIHVEKKRSWWDGSSTTVCGIKIKKFKAVSKLFNKVNCGACAQLDKP
jgi:hypothetical protein